MTTAVLKTATNPLFGFDLECRVRFLRLQPDDIVVLSTDQHLEVDQNRELRRIVGEYLQSIGLNNPVLITNSGLQVSYFSADDLAEFRRTRDELRADYAARGGDPDEHS